jgi:hypothetical protein
MKDEQRLKQLKAAQAKEDARLEEITRQEAKLLEKQKQRDRQKAIQEEKARKEAEEKQRKETLHAEEQARREEKLRRKAEAQLKREAELEAKKCKEMARKEAEIHAREEAEKEYAKREAEEFERHRIESAERMRHPESHPKLNHHAIDHARKLKQVYEAKAAHNITLKSKRLSPNTIELLQEPSPPIQYQQEMTPSVRNFFQNASTAQAALASFETQKSAPLHHYIPPISKLGIPLEPVSNTNIPNLTGLWSDSKISQPVAALGSSVLSDAARISPKIGSWNPSVAPGFGPSSSFSHDRSNLFDYSDDFNIMSPTEEMRRKEMGPPPLDSNGGRILGLQGMEASRKESPWIPSQPAPGFRTQPVLPSPVFPSQPAPGFRTQPVLPSPVFQNYGFQHTSQNSQSDLWTSPPNLGRNNVNSQQYREELIQQQNLNNGIGYPPGMQPRTHYATNTQPLRNFFQ